MVPSLWVRKDVIKRVSVRRRLAVPVLDASFSLPYFIDDSDEMTTFVIENVDPPQSTAVESTIGTVRVRDRRTTSG
jgi:hypothetical protein